MTLVKAGAKVGSRVRGDGTDRLGTVVRNADWDVDVQVLWDGTLEEENVDPFFLTEVRA